MEQKLCHSLTLVDANSHQICLILKTSAAAGVSVSLAGSEGVKICDLCYCEAAPDQVLQLVDLKVTNLHSVS